MDGFMLVIIFAVLIIVFILFAYWTFSKIFTAVQVRGESMNELETRINELEERIRILEEASGESTYTE